MKRNTAKKRQRIVVFFGLTASGKSYLAKKWADRHGFPYFNTDVIRKEMAGMTSTLSCAESIEKGIYSPEFSRLTYAALRDRMAQRLMYNPLLSCVVADGSYHSRSERQQLIERFAEWCEIVFVLCHCPEKQTKERLAARLDDPAAVSDGSWEIYLHQKSIFEKPDELCDEQLLELDTNASVEYLIDRLDRLLRMTSLNKT